ncbi:hypothetical protein, partial [Escherichia coli]
IDPLRSEFGNGSATRRRYCKIPSGQNSVMVLLHEEGIASGVPEMKNEKESRKLRRLKMKTHYDSAQCVTFLHQR